MDKTEIADVIASLGLTIDATFVPFDQSRNVNEKWRSLNWKVTVKRNGRDVLTTDYSAGIAHCPSYSKKAPAAWDRPARMWPDLVAKFETETGFQAQPYTTWGGFRADKTKPIKPDTVDVLHSLTLDSSVLDAGGFEDWADEFGYDTDSRSAEATYRACLELALKLRAALGDSGVNLLRDAFADY
jgi:hypothetical protein